MGRIARHFLENTPFALRYHARVAILLSEEEVEYETTDGKKYQHDNPSEAFHGIAVFEYDDDGGKDNRQYKPRIYAQV